MGGPEIWDREQAETATTAQVSRTPSLARRTDKTAGPLRSIPRANQMSLWRIDPGFVRSFAEM
jgi:hypothetical protein